MRRSLDGRRPKSTRPADLVPRGACHREGRRSAGGGQVGRAGDVVDYLAQGVKGRWGRPTGAPDEDDLGLVAGERDEDDPTAE